MDKAAQYLGIMRKAGLLECGEHDAGVAVRAGKARLLLLASDASDNARRRAEGFVYGRNTPLVRVPYTKAELSALTGKAGGALAAATDIGLAAAFMRALAAADAESYGALAEQVEARRAEMEKRKQDAAAHTRNMRIGKRRNNV